MQLAPTTLPHPRSLGMTMTYLLLVVLSFLLVPAAWSQGVRPISEPPPPGLFIEQGDSREPLSIAAVDVDTRVVGHLAETRMTLTFANPHPRPLGGELVFPLPEGSTVSGYALEVQGVMVDGVVVEKDRGRQIFEAEVRKGIDPGLVEWTGGSSFRTRVFPIPAEGTRRVAVSWTSELVHEDDGWQYQLPLQFPDKLGSFDLRIEVLRAERAPQLRASGLAEVTFSETRSAWVAEANLSDAVADQDLFVLLPDLEQRPVAVQHAPDGGFTFSIHDTVQAPKTRQNKSRVRRVGLLWDASASRVQADLEREIGLLETWLGSLPGQVAVDLIVIRHRAEPALHFELPADKQQLLTTVSKIEYDGGTQLAALSPAAGHTRPDLYLLFTDGVSTFGRERPEGLDAPVYVVNSATTANHAFLRYLALDSGGAAFNLARVRDAEVLSQIGSSVFSFMGATIDGVPATDSFPSLQEAVTGGFTFTGKLAAAQSTVELSFGVGGQVMLQRSYVVTQAMASEGDLLARAWAAKQVEELAIFPKRNAEDMVALGKQYGIVTPGTSLLVLETLDQYVEHRVRPPQSLASMAADWDKAMERMAKEVKAVEAGKLSHVLELWQGYIAWYQAEYEWPKHKIEAEGKKGEAEAADMAPMERSGMLSSSRSRRGSSAAMADEMAVGSPAAMAEPEAMDAGMDTPAPRGPTISLAPWNPDTPYLAAMRKADPAEAWWVYLEQRPEHGDAPAFYLDCADFFRDAGDEARALQVLSNIAELELENPALLRVLARRLIQIGEHDLSVLTFERVLELRPEEPQSYRDLALALARRAEATTDDHAAARARDDYERALELLAHVVMERWDRFDQIELIALVELNNILDQAKSLGVRDAPVDSRLIHHIELDTRIAMSWDADLTDMDLHVLEPSGEEAYYGHNLTIIGGRVSRDFTQGYGPESYALRRAMPGVYRVETNYYGSSAVQLTGVVTLQLDLYTDWGRPTQHRESITMRLEERKDRVLVGEIELGG